MIRDCEADCHKRGGGGFADAKRRRQNLVFTIGYLDLTSCSYQPAIANSVSGVQIVMV